MCEVPIRKEAFHAGLRTGQPLSATPQPVIDSTGVVSVLSLSTTSVGIGTPLPEVALHVAGDLRLEYNGSPKLILFSLHRDTLTTRSFMAIWLGQSGRAEATGGSEDPPPEVPLRYLAWIHR